jgi:hypothetical protein
VPALVVCFRIGGGGVAPAVSTGSTDVEMNVNLTYELLSR